MLKGIPYFYENNNEVYRYLIEKEVSDKIEENTDIKETSILDLINWIFNNDINAAIIIDNTFISFIRDIQFNYANHIIEIPYMRYEVDTVESKTTNKHIIRKSSKEVYVRYNYEYAKHQIKLGDTLKILSISDEKINISQVKLTSYTGSLSEASTEKLLELYHNYCYQDDDYRITKHLEGYTYITKDFINVKNKENYLRKSFNLPTYKDDVHPKEIDYRDVREYRADQLMQNTTLWLNSSNSEPYQIRRLRFEGYLYCILAEHLNFKEEDIYSKLQHKKIYKIGTEKPLILKNYWIS